MLTIKKVTVCGGGNATHVVVPLLKNEGLSVTLYTPFAEEAAKFKAGIARGGIIDHDRQLQGSPDLITTEPEEAAQADLILLVLPAFAHELTLEALASHLPPEVIVGAIPARSGFELPALKYVRKESSKRIIFCCQTLPWACRIVEYGREVKVLGTKESIGLATIQPESAAEISKLLSKYLKVNFVPMVNSLAVSLGNVGQVIHPGIMYGLLKDYDGAIWSEDEIPLFYQGVTEEIAELMIGLSEEIVQTAKLLSQEHNVDLKEVLTVRQWLMRSYAATIEDDSTLARAFRTNRSYRGLKIPVKEFANGFVPDFKSRYLTEDIPFGLLYSKAVAKMVGFPTPHMNEVITNAGEWIGKRYLNKDGNITGPDIAEARIPQNYDIIDPKHLVKASLGINL